MSFKLGVTIPIRNMYQFSDSHHNHNKPIIIPKKPEPNIFFTPLEDNREKYLIELRKDLDKQLELRKLDYLH